MNTIITEAYLKCKCPICNATRDILITSATYESLISQQMEFHELHSKCSGFLLKEENVSSASNGSKPDDGGSVEFEKQWMMACIEDALIVADEQGEQWGNSDTARLSVQKIRKEIPLKYLKANNR